MRARCENWATWFLFGRNKTRCLQTVHGQDGIAAEKEMDPNPEPKAVSSLRTLLGDSGSFVAKMNEHAVNTTKKCRATDLDHRFAKTCDDFCVCFVFFHGFVPRKCELFVSQPCMQLFRIETSCCFNLPTFRWWKLMYPR